MAKKSRLLPVGPLSGARAAAAAPVPPVTPAASKRVFLYAEPASICSHFGDCYLPWQCPHALPDWWLAEHGILAGDFYVLCPVYEQVST